MVLTLRGPLWGPRFAALLDELLPLASIAGMTSNAFRYRGDWLSRAEEHLVGTTKVREWPGVISLAPVQHYAFAYSRAFVDVLLAQCHNPFRLQEQAMPDNLHLLSPTGRVVLGTNSCDRSAWTQLTANEWSEMVNRRPVLSSLRTMPPADPDLRTEDGERWPGWSDPWLPGAPE